MALGSGLKAWSAFGTIDLRGVGRAQSKLAAFDQSGQKSARGMAGLAASGSRAGAGIAIIGLAAGAMAVESVRAFSEFDAAMTQSLAIMGDVSSTMRDDMSQAAREVALSTQFSANDAAESFFFLASAGLNAEESIAALPVVANFAQAGMFDMARATDILTDAQSALGLSTDDIVQNLENMERVSDALVAANTLANASVEQFGQALTNRAAARMRQFNIEVEEGVAVLSAFADQGVKGRRAGQQLNILLRDLPVAARNNAEAFRTMNIEIFDTEGNIRNVADIIEDFEVALDGASDEQRVMALELLNLNQRAGDALSALLGTSEAIREYEKGIREAGGVTRTVAERQLETFRQQLGLLGDNLKEVFLTIGEGLTPATNNFLKTANNVFPEIHAMVVVLMEAFSGLVDIIAFIPRKINDVGNAVDDFLRNEGPRFQNFIRSLFDLEGIPSDADRGFARTTGTQDILFNQLIADFPEVRTLIKELRDEVSLTDREAFTLWQTLENMEDTLTGPALRAVLPEELTEQFSNVSDETLVMLKLLDDATGFLSEMKKETEETEEATKSFSELMQERLDKLKAQLESSTSEFETQSTLLGDIFSLAQAQEQTNRDNLSTLRMAVEPLAVINELYEAGALSLREQAQRLNLIARSVGLIERRADFEPDDDAAIGRTIIDSGFLFGPAMRVPLEQASATTTKGVVDTVSQTLGERFPRLENEMRRAGTNLITSLARGTLDAKDIIATAIRIIASNFIMPGIIDAFGIFSPSKWMMNRGRDLMEGLALGITRNATMVSTAMNTAMAPVMAATSLRPNIARAAAAANGIGQELTIDMTNMPPARNPMEHIRDEDWQLVLSRSIKVARKDGRV